MQSIQNKLISSLKWQTLFQVLTQTFSWGVTIFMVRILNPEDYGIMGMAMIVIGFMNLLNDIGLGASIIQKEDLEKNILSSIFWMGMIVSAMVYAVIWTSSPIISSIFNQPELKLIIRVIGLGLIFKSLRLLSYHLLIKEMKFKQKGTAEFLSNVVSSLICLAAALNGFNYWSLVIGYLFKEFLLTIISFIYYPYFPSFKFTSAAIRSVISFGSQVTASRVLWYFYSNSDYLVIGRFMGEKVLGFYSVAFQLASMPISKINLIVREVTFPAYSLIQSRESELKELYLKNILTVSILLFPVYSGLFIIADDFFSIIVGVKWAESVYYFKIFCLVGIMKSLVSQNSPVLSAIGRPDINVRYSFIMVLVMPLSFVISIQYGIKYMALCWLFVYPVPSFYVISVTLRELKISKYEYLKTVLPSLSACLVMISIIHVFQQFTSHTLLRLSGSVLTGVLIYTLITYSFNRQEMLGTIRKLMHQ